MTTKILIRLAGCTGWSESSLGAQVILSRSGSVIFSGRASATPTLDLFITLLSLGSKGYKELLVVRKELYQYLQLKLEQCAQNNGERLLDVRHNPISLGEQNLQCYTHSIIFIVMHLSSPYYIKLLCCDRQHLLPVSWTDVYMYF